MNVGEYTSFEYERSLNNAMATHGERLFSEREYKAFVSSRFADERMDDLRRGAAALGIVGRSRMTREALLDAIAQVRWERLPARFKVRAARCER